MSDMCVCCRSFCVSDQENKGHAWLSAPPPTNIWACVPGRCSPGNLDEGVRRLYIRDVPEQIDLIQEQQVDNRNQELPSRLRHVLLGSVNLQPPISALFQVL